ncbi:MAG: nucleoside deaminase [Gemmatimonadales bacterium]
MDNTALMRRAISLAEEMMRAGKGGPFGAVVAKDGEIVGEGYNQVTSLNDPTAHAEIVAIRQACDTLGDFRLDGCEIFANCEPCPMCLSAIYWARMDRIYYANTRADAARIGFDDATIYEQLQLPVGRRSIAATRLLADEAEPAFREWDEMEDKIVY